MTRNTLISIVLLLLLHVTVHAQTDSITLKGSSFFKVLQSHGTKSPALTWVKQSVFKFDSIPFGDKSGYHQEILVFNGGLYLRLDASGILYKNVPGTNTFSRIDKTEHFGYNINSYFFADSSHIYNIGGYGFWRWTGHLRVFNNLIGGWDIIKINKELGLSKSSPETFIWNNKKSNKLIALNYLIGNDGIEGNENKSFARIDSVVELNLKTGKWETLGHVNKRISTKTNEFSKIAELDSGLLLNNLGNLEYWNLIDNQIYFIKNGHQKQIILNKVNNSWSWYSNGFLYYGNPNNNEIDSIFLDKSLYLPTEEKVYDTSSNLPRTYLIGGGVFLLGLIIFYAKIKSHKKINVNNTDDQIVIQQNTQHPSYSHNELYTEVEKSVLKLLIDNTEKNGTKTSTEDINRMLGVAKSSVNMQKRKRSDTIKTINQKFKNRYPDKNADLIIRNKSSIDARIQEYSIDSSYISNLKELLSLK